MFNKIICVALSIAVLLAGLTVVTSAAQPSSDRLLVTITSEKTASYKEYSDKYKAVNSSESEIPLLRLM